MNTIVVSGLLGAGKTTFLQHYARRVSGKTVILVNDFGRAGIDGEIFSADGIESIELPSGCVCCTLKFDLITTLKKITEGHVPDFLLIEPSGISSPSGVIEVLDMLGITPLTVVGIVDATEFPGLYEEQMYGNFFEDQIRTADIILVNKTDLADAGMVGRTRDIVGSLNPGAVIFETVNAEIHVPLPSPQGHGSITGKSDTHLVFDTISLRLGREVDFSFFRTFFKDIAGGAYGTVVRAKALVMTERGPYRFDAVYGKPDNRTFAGELAESRLVVIGEDLKKDALLSAAGRIQS